MGAGRDYNRTVLYLSYNYTVIIGKKDGIIIHKSLGYRTVHFILYHANFRIMFIYSAAKYSNCSTVLLRIGIRVS